MTTETTVEAVRSMTNKEIVTTILDMQRTIVDLQAKIAELSTPKAKAEGREMTDDDAKRILNGDLAQTKHKDAAEKLGLTYGQIYSCRLEHTFKPVHKALQATGWKNSWVK